MKNIITFLIFVTFYLPFFAFDAEASTAQCPELTGLQKVAGFVNFLTVFQIVIIGTGFWSLTILFPVWYKRLRHLFGKMPPVVYEIGLYLLSMALIVTGLLASPQPIFELGLIGSLLLPMAILYSSYLHQWKANPTLFFLILMMTWGMVTLLYESAIIGFLTVGALMGMVGFSIGIERLCYAFGFKSKEVIPTATLTAFIVLTLFITLHIMNIRIPSVLLFESGAFWLGGLVMYTGLLLGVIKGVGNTGVIKGVGNTSFMQHVNFSNNSPTPHSL